MPYRPLGPCSVQGCPERAVRRGRCARHAAEAEARYRAEHPDERPNFRERGYSSKWDTLRKEFIRRHPRCVLCGGRASHVDHIVPRRQGGTDDVANLQALCWSCHSRKTATVDGGFGNKVRE